MRYGILVTATFAWIASVGAGLSSQRLPAALLRNHPAISYERAPVTNAISELSARLRAGEVTLESKGPSGYLESLLKALHVPIESQVLVFSKTSFQAPRINPKNPRAIYFNDTVSVGWVRGGPVLEVIAQDPKQGTIFYTLEQTQSGVPQFAQKARLARLELAKKLGVPRVQAKFPGWPPASTGSRSAESFRTAPWMGRRVAPSP
jgi:hypothetical protein